MSKSSARSGVHIPKCRLPDCGLGALDLGLLRICAALCTVLLVVPPGAPAQSAIDPRAFVQINLPADGPVELLNVNYGSSRILRSERAMTMDLDVTLTLRNRSAKPIDGLAIALGWGLARSEGLNAVSGIRLEAGQNYALPARMHAEIETPPARSRARLADLPSGARVRLDAVLFADGSGYGPDQMRSLGMLRINQAESARDRRFFLALFQSGGLPRLLPVLEKWVNEAHTIPGAQRALAGDPAERAREQADAAVFRVVRLPGAPLEILSGRARLSEGRLVDPILEVRNQGGKPITDFQVGWVLRDLSGTEFRAATTTASARSSAWAGLPLAGGQTISWSNPTVLEVGPSGSRVLAGRVYVRAVEFADGQVWVPDRVALESMNLSSVATTSPETFRLFGLYRAQGAGSLLADLRR